MEIKITTQQMLKILQVVSWIIFIGLCIDAGGIVFNVVCTFAISPLYTSNFWKEADLSALYRYDPGYFVVIALLMVIVAVLKALLFYLIIKLFINKRLNLSRPFSFEIKQLLLNISWLILGIGLFSHSGREYAEWLSKRGVKMPDPQSMRLDGADVWLFMAVILFVVAQVIKRGIEIQRENDLTI